MEVIFHKICTIVTGLYASVCPNTENESCNVNAVHNIINQGMFSWVFYLQFEWVQEHLGQDWTGRMIVTKDKTMAYGDILIDDRPNVTGTNSS